MSVERIMLEINLNLFKPNLDLLDLILLSSWKNNCFIKQKLLLIFFLWDYLWSKTKPEKESEDVCS